MLEIIQTGSITGTGASINVSCGFVPKTVTLFNITSGDQLDWVDSMADGYGFKRVAAGTGSQITSGGITPYGLTAEDTFRGFKIGTDTDVNVNGEVIRYRAFR